MVLPLSSLSLKQPKIHHNICTINSTSLYRHGHMLRESMASSKHIYNAQTMILKSKCQHQTLLEIPVKNGLPCHIAQATIIQGITTKPSNLDIIQVEYIYYNISQIQIKITRGTYKKTKHRS